MDEKIIKEVDENSIKLPGGKYAMMHNGKLVILEKINTYGSGYRSIVSFSYNDFEVLKQIANNEYLRVIGG